MCAKEINVFVSQGKYTPGSHSDLTGLENDDHPQYLLTDGSRALSDNWDIDGKNITTVGTLAIGTGNPSARLEILGSSDIIQAIIQGITSQASDVMRVGDVVNGNYFAVESTGFFRLAGSARVTKDENFSATQLLATGGVNQPKLITIPGTSIIIPAFEGNKTQQGSDHRELQHDYKQTTDLRPHIHWWPTDANAGVVRWGLEYFIKSSSTILAQGVTYVESAAPGVTWKEVRTEFNVITGTSLTIGNQISFRFFRDGLHVNDTYPSDAAVTTYGYHYEIDTLGSRGTFSK